MKKKIFQISLMQGLGNQFAIIDLTQTNNFKQTDINPHLITQINQQIKSPTIDQYLFLDYPSKKTADFDYLVFNIDGSQAEQCVNGARAIAKFINDQHNINKKDYCLKIADGSLMQLSYLDDQCISVLLAKESFAAKTIGLNAKNLTKKSNCYSYLINYKNGEKNEVLFDAVSIANPHMVIDVKLNHFLNYPKIPFEQLSINSISAQIQADKNLFINGVNINFVELINKNYLKLRTYERGVGETLACGSGACAAFAVYNAKGYLADQIEVELKGGKLQIARAQNDKIKLTGAANWQENRIIELI